MIRSLYKYGHLNYWQKVMNVRGGEKVNRTIRKAAVLGSGIMGGGIAAILAGVGIPCYLLDIIPNKLTEEEIQKNLSLKDPIVRNRIVQKNKEAVIKSKPALLFSKDDADLITIGNFEDNLEWLKEADWVVEVIIENLEIKKQLYNKIIPFIKPGAIISSNTSGIRINDLAQSLPAEMRKYFLGTHFFNPVRYMKLFELIPGNETLPEVIDFMAGFAEKTLGKGVVYAKDTPSFVANRIGLFSMLGTLRLAGEFGLGVEEVDSLTGTLVGKPKTATFKLTDMVGVDLCVASPAIVRENISDEKEKQYFTGPEYIFKMAENGMHGNKTGGGFYKKTKKAAGKKETLVLNLDTLEYESAKKPEVPGIKELKAVKSTPERLQKILEYDSIAARFLWEDLKGCLTYSAAKIPEISDNILNIDNAMRFGYGWQMGPFQMWDAIGVEAFVARAEKEGAQIAGWVKEMLEKGCNKFYTVIDNVPSYYCALDKKYLPVPYAKEIINLPLLKKQNKIIARNADATLIDIGDGVACLELHSRGNTLSELCKPMLELAMNITEENDDWLGLVITSAGPNFCVGGDLGYLLSVSNNSTVNEAADALKTLQDTLMRMKYFSKPIVTAPFDMTLGGGLELCMHSTAIQPHAECYMGLVEVGVGLIPGGGGTKEALLRQMEKIPPGIKVKPEPFIEKAFENIMQAKVSKSAKEAAKLGYLRPTDKISINKDHQLYDAKQKVLALAAEGYAPPAPAQIPAAGEDGVSMFAVMAYNMKVAGLATEHDYLVARKLTHVLGGGYLKPGTVMSEEYLLSLEREAFSILINEEKTKARMEHMLATGKPLRN